MLDVLESRVCKFRGVEKGIVVRYEVEGFANSLRIRYE